MFRLSSYTILSTRLPSGGYVLMNGLSGSMDFISERIGAPLANALHPRNEAAIEEVIGTLPLPLKKEWYDRGHLVEMSRAEEQENVVNLAGALHDALHSKPAFMIVPNLDCNYRCTYCFERPMQNALKSTSGEISHHKGNVVMSREQADAALAAIAEIKKTRGQPPGGQIVLYGGEPLDRANLDVVTHIVRSGQAAGHHFACITNGHDLEAFLELIGSGGIEQVQISIDGPKDIHDKRRVYIGKESSFDKIVANIDLALEQTDAQIQIRVHVDPSNIHHFDTIISDFALRGWIDHPQVIIYANTVYDKDVEGTVHAEIDHGDIVTALNDRCREFDNVFTSAPAIHAERAMGPVFNENARFGLKSTFCSANTGNFIMAADGHVYACWESVGKACSRIGAYGPDKSLSLDEKATERWFSRSIETLPTCQRCRYALVCGGGCAQYAEYNTGDIYNAYCDDFERTFRAALSEHSERQITHALASAPSEK
ncbi:radical SAM protein [Maricaulis sp.]|uniref:radical SAM/SPASM domain-containing protein n=1 Tax=unclassified Maricaulis TaxID=2632371 RepID=UPI001B1AD815|nr:radical SAM protein [Maricaulis sp.]MBO6796637.1 radical SAM protein [Maricaulis sp.]